MYAEAQSIKGLYKDVHSQREMGTCIYLDRNIVLALLSLYSDILMMPAGFTRKLIFGAIIQHLLHL